MTFSRILALILAAVVLIAAMPSRADDEPDEVFVLLFTQANCPPCKQYEPEFDRLSKKFVKPGVVFRVVDIGTGDGEKLAAQAKVTATPTVVVTKGNRPLIRWVSPRPTEADLRLITTYPTEETAALIVTRIKAEAKVAAGKADTGTCAAPKCPAGSCLTGDGLKRLCDLTRDHEYPPLGGNRPVAEAGGPAIVIDSGTLPDGTEWKRYEYRTPAGGFGRYVQAGQSVVFQAIPEPSYGCFERDRQP
jgi:thiol-disulfide isomerase/thioredoxin